jgi:hypothetical protein
MTGYLRFLASIEAIGYAIYLFLLMFGQLNLPNGLVFVSFLVVTFSVITSEVILISIIQLREAVFDRNQDIPVALRSKPNQFLETQPTGTGTTNILEKGGTLIEQNSMTKKWICSCGLHNPTSSYECLSCTKRRPFTNR